LFDQLPPRRVLVVSPHPDDETLGAGGSIAKWTARGHEVTVLTIAGHLPPLYTMELYEETEREARAAFQVLGVAHQHFLRIPALFLGNEPGYVLNERIAAVARELEPHVVLTPYPDRHVDHRLIFESVMVVTRPVGFGCGIELVAAYETLSETHWNAPHIEPNFVPNWTVDITDSIDAKLRALRSYASRIPAFPGARSVEAVEALAKLRGTQAGFAYGESFHIVRMKG
jgi:LmbE family N-acetylglucosaminyl deacetylase